MHTDEYEISLSREIAFCRRMVRSTKDTLDQREKQCGMTTAEFLRALEEGRVSEERLIKTWKQEYQEWRYWQKNLAEYEEALESLKLL